MSEYIVEVRDTGEVVYAYSADVATEFPEYPFAQYNHILQKEAPQPPPIARRVTKLDFVTRLGADYVSLLETAKTSIEVESFIKMIDWATPEQDGTSIDLDDVRVVAGLTQLLGTVRAGEVLA